MPVAAPADAAEDVAAADHHADLDAERRGPAATSSAMRSTIVGSMPYSRSPISASPGDLEQDPAIAGRLSPCRSARLSAADLVSALGSAGRAWPPLRRRSRRCSFSMPSPSSKRTKPVDLDRARRVLGRLLDRLLRPGSRRRCTQTCSSSTDFLVVLAHPAFDHLLDDRLGLAAGAGLLGQHGALALERGRIDVGDVSASRPGRGDMHARSACRAAELGLVAGRFQRRPARRSCPARRERRCGHRPRPRRPSTDSAAARRRVMFSPIVATSWVSSSATVRPVPG